eukprot:GILK01007560.1.p1 GENE.GILK01007560.1~~GILK01007560.1.p1  ORF type:complete len:341 (+),score=57.74 GILK01007560.1:34-1023(+)
MEVLLQELPVVVQVRKSLDNNAAAVVLGAPATAKTEQLILAIGKAVPVFDLRQRFLEQYAEQLTDRTEVKTLRGRYSQLKETENTWLKASYEQILQELSNNDADTILFDEFDLCTDACLSPIEQDTATLIVKMAAELRRTKKVVLIIHFQGFRTHSLMRDLQANGLVHTESDLIQTAFLSPVAESRLLALFGFDRESTSRFMADAQGLPAAYMACFLQLNELVLGRIPTLPLLSEQELRETATRVIQSSLHVAKLIQGHHIASSILKAANLNEQPPNDIQKEDNLSVNETELLETGLVGCRCENGQKKVVVPVMVVNIIQRSRSARTAS